MTLTLRAIRYECDVCEAQGDSPFNIAHNKNEDGSECLFVRQMKLKKLVGEINSNYRYIPDYMRASMTSAEFFPGFNYLSELMAKRLIETGRVVYDSIILEESDFK